jgi:hypothetical protein
VNPKIPTPKFIGFLLVVFCLSALSRSDGATVGYWDFEEGSAGSAAAGSNSILDSSGNGLNGTPVNGPVYSSSVPAGSASTLSLDLNGTNQRVFVPDDPRLSLTHSLTLEASIFARPLQDGEIGGDIIFRGDDRIGLDPYRLTLQFTGDVLFQITDSSGQSASLLANIPFNQWVNIAGVLDDVTGAMKVYVNGSLANSTTTTVRPFGPLDAGQAPGLGIGGLNSSNPNLGPEYFNGLIDQVRISDAALDPAQFLVPEPSQFAFGLFGCMLVFLRRGKNYKARPCRTCLGDASE